MCVVAHSPAFTENYDELREYDLVIQAGKATADTYRKRGHAFQMIQEVQAALEDTTRAIEFDPPLETHQMAAAYSQRCVLNRRLSRHAEAIADGEKAIQLHPEYLPYRLDLAAARVSAQDYEGAFVDVEIVLSEEPNQIEALYWRILANKKLGNSQAVIDDFDAFFKSTPYDISATLRRMRAEEYLNLGDYHEAEHDCTHGLELNTKRRDHEVMALLSLRGWARYYQGNSEGAMGDFMDCLDLNENAVYAYLGQGLVFHALGLDMAAQSNFSRFADLHPDGSMAAMREVAYHLQKAERVLDAVPA